MFIAQLTTSKTDKCQAKTTEFRAIEWNTKKPKPIYRPEADNFGPQNTPSYIRLHHFYTVSIHHFLPYTEVLVKKKKGPGVDVSFRLAKSSYLHLMEELHLHPQQFLNTLDLIKTSGIPKRPEPDQDKPTPTEQHQSHSSKNKQTPLNSNKRTGWWMQQTPAKVLAPSSIVTRSKAKEFQLALANQQSPKIAIESKQHEGEQKLAKCNASPSKKEHTAPMYLPHPDEFDFDELELDELELELPSSQPQLTTQKEIHRALQQSFLAENFAPQSLHAPKVNVEQEVGEIKREFISKFKTLPSLRAEIC